MPPFAPLSAQHSKQGSTLGSKQRTANRFLAFGIVIATIACTSKPLVNNQALASDGGSVCALNESVTTTSGTYSSNVDLTASLALPGDTAVDVVMTPQGANRQVSAYAIAATNTENSAFLSWVNPATGEISRSVEWPTPISDIAFNGAEELAIASQNTLTRLNITTGETLSQISLPNVKRVAITPDGHLGAIADKTIHLYDDNNNNIFSKLRDYTAVTDIEVFSCNGQQIVYATSFQNARFTGLNGKRNPVQIARLEAFDTNGELLWDLFGDRPETIKQNVADTRLYRVTMGRDGYLYIAGESAGTATIFRWRGQPMTEEEQLGRTPPFLSRIDENSSLHNSGAAHLPYYARVHPTEGRLVTAQMSFPRLSNTKANAMRLGDIAVGASGSLYFGGAASASIPNRENLTLNGVSVGEYGGRDRAWMAIAPDFQARKFWTVLAEASAEDSGKGMVRGVDVGYGYSAAISNVKSGRVPVTTGEETGNVFLSFTAE